MRLETGFEAGIALAHDFLPADTCRGIVAAMESVIKWRRHTGGETYYPEVDLDRVMPELMYNVSELVRASYELVGPAVHMVPRRVKAAFAVKYSSETQDGCGPHTDPCDLSYCIALNDDYRGGGLHLTKYTAAGGHSFDRQLHYGTGTAALFWGGHILHRALPVTAGTRYIITVWNDADFIGG